MIDTSYPIKWVAESFPLEPIPGSIDILSNDVSLVESEMDEIVSFFGGRAYAGSWKAFWCGKLGI
jgi:hypothetical protein